MKAAEGALKRISALIVVDSSAEAIADMHRDIAHQLESLGAEYEMLYLVGTADKTVREQVQRIWLEEAGPVMRMDSRIARTPMKRCMSPYRSNPLTTELR